MTAFHEHIRLVLTDVERFCNEGLNGVKLSKKLTQDKEKIIKGLTSLFEEYPNIKPQSETKTRSKSKDDRDVSNGSVKTNDSGHNEEEETAENYSEVAFKDLENPDKCGYLEKKRKKELHVPVTLFKQSQKRYCAIQKNVFYYYEKPTDKKQCGAFSLVGYEFKPAPDKVKDAAKKNFCFELSAPNKRCYESELVFIADSQEDFDSWKEAIDKATNASQDEIIETEDIYEAIGEDAPGPPDLPPPVSTRKVPAIPPPQAPAIEVEDEAQPPETEEIYADAESADTELEPAPDMPQVPPLRRPSKPDIAVPGLPPPRGAPSKPTIAPPTVPPARKSPLPDRKPDMPPPPTPNTPLPPLPSTPLPHTPPSIPLPAVPAPVKKKIICPAEDYENMFYGRWDCKGGADDELSFKRGDIIHVINFDFDKDNWWVGELMGKYGLVPKEFLTRAYEEVTAA
ncbi:src kinase-associated phosphoprotein 2-like isoform X1 [Gigantopelta aegis]|uniref:src kinase-associated phosphoprotein 2-like isoform X1 n=1 Tax=Gigantopelta aegis TaxID=1735272 RepID=UPI001B88E611|nr:src kinase-associated phosphoprotein 2-like isoform X1 [Gigantopelta aegis]